MTDKEENKPIDYEMELVKLLGKSGKPIVINCEFTPEYPLDMRKMERAIIYKCTFNNKAIIR